MATITIYTTPYCPYCNRAKQLLDSKEVSYEEIDVSDRSLRPNMTKITGGTTVPQIIINGNPIGGCDELYALERAEQLDTLLS
ncbi:glutaredoxin 3 [Psychromonas algicola]|uniref:glutaredoxin 3 n=1 Tax=Psychromonas algicola TaxID=2555642 RepID=UPI001068CFC4|nr:glutaredoxin 3 [Psychromonas sp. RZ5]TEW44743.1 glutaredoxin 3 [Psychromonas sp. RZ5]